MKNKIYNSIKIMTRKEQIRDAAEFYSKKNKIVPIPYLDFIEAAEWADRTMIEKIYLWLEDNIDKYAKAVLHSNGDGKLEEKIVLTKSFQKDFTKAMEE